LDPCFYNECDSQHTSGDGFLTATACIRIHHIKAWRNRRDGKHCDGTNKRCGLLLTRVKYALSFCLKMQFSVGFTVGFTVFGAAVVRSNREN
ncbi:hypothetical protein, partial [Shewanella sp.]|uniref:hypothetical protein n=1 Tax=Shewanella sp. TaxID=50422 RepID=UPI00356A7F63